MAGASSLTKLPADSSAGDSFGSPTARHNQLNIQEAVTGAGAGKKTGFVASEDAIAVARDEAVFPVAKRPGDNAQEHTENLPNAAELLHHEQDGVGPNQQVLLGRFVVDDDVDRVEIAGVGAVASQDSGGQSALQRGKAEDGVAVAAEDGTARTGCKVRRRRRRGGWAGTCVLDTEDFTTRAAPERNTETPAEARSVSSAEYTFRGRRQT